MFTHRYYRAHVPCHVGLDVYLSPDTGMGLDRTSVFALGHSMSRASCAAEPLWELIVYGTAPLVPPFYLLLIGLCSLQLLATLNHGQWWAVSGLYFYSLFTGSYGQPDFSCSTHKAACSTPQRNVQNHPFTYPKPGF